MKFLRDESVLIVALLQAGLVLGGAFGLHLTAGQITGLVGFFSAVLALVIRQAVASPSTVAQVASQAATKTAEQLDSVAAGAAGTLTLTGEKLANDVVTGVLGNVGGLLGTLTKGG